jgi:hypothetical protein
LSASISSEILWSGPCRLTHTARTGLNNVTRFQLNAIPTVGFSDPILSYFSAVHFIFDGVRMLKEGYQKVIRLFSRAPFYQTDDVPTSRQDQVYSKSPIFGDGWC